MEMRRAEIVCVGHKEGSIQHKVPTHSACCKSASSYQGTSTFSCGMLCGKDEVLCFVPSFQILPCHTWDWTASHANICITACMGVFVADKLHSVCAHTHRHRHKNRKGKARRRETKALGLCSDEREALIVCLCSPKSNSYRACCCPCVVSLVAVANKFMNHNNSDRGCLNPVSTLCSVLPSASQSSRFSSLTVFMCESVLTQIGQTEMDPGEQCSHRHIDTISSIPTREQTLSLSHSRTQTRGPECAAWIGNRIDEKSQSETGWCLLLCAQNKKNNNKKQCSQDQKHDMSVYLSGTTFAC